MVTSKTLLAGAVAITLAVSGCASQQNNPKQAGGAVIGGIGGALLGSMFGSGTGRLAAVAAGTLVGAMIGQEVGRSLDAADRAAIDRAERRATTAPVGETIKWNNPDSGNSGTITPVRDGQDTRGRYCREFRQTIEVGGKLEEGYGTACRQEDGSWQIMT
ncbi:RT0821/Lpp0805 family surface protein [Sneathiella chinensis]|uniref:17 kDa surface antigen n=1 Tax=Sneathiella chinensis TaxID=349750 RepID=A0ABQ5U4E2_9PROT|nr:RT0821/Lpp0805 family surface protein [Sneathiella chinensis]GLQ06545.1 17 kDa surface antigen [Sneathiella chinensis]